MKKTYATVTRADPPVHVTENVENESRVEQESVPERQGTAQKGADEVHMYSIDNEIINMAVNRVNDESANVPVGCVNDTEEESQPAEGMVVDIGLRKPLKRSFLNTGKEDKGSKVLVVQAENSPNDADSESGAEIMPPAHDENKEIAVSRDQTCKGKLITDGDINGDVSTLPLEEKEDEEPKVDGDGAGSTEAKLAAEAQPTDHDEPVVVADDLPSSVLEALNVPQEEEEHSEEVKENIVRFLKETFRQRNV